MAGPKPAASEDAFAALIRGALKNRNENWISKNVLVHLLRRIGLSDVRFVGGPSEKGLDILYAEQAPPETEPRWVGIQFKKVDITAKAGGRKSPSQLEDEIQKAFGRPVGFPDANPYTRISSLVIASLGRITDQARQDLEDGTFGSRRCGAPLRFWNGERLCGWIRDYWLDEFVQLTGIRVPPGVVRISIPASANPLDIGRGLRSIGNSVEATSQFRTLLSDSARELASTYLSSGASELDHMRQATDAAMAFDTAHYDQYWTAGYVAFRQERFVDAKRHLEEAIRILDSDRSDRVQQGVGFQIRREQALAMLLAVAQKLQKPDEVAKLAGEFKTQGMRVAKLGPVAETTAARARLTLPEIPGPTITS